MRKLGPLLALILTACGVAGASQNAAVDPEGQYDNAAALDIDADVDNATVAARIEARAAYRAAAARWWIVSITDTAIHLAEGPPRGRSTSAQELWVNSIDVAPGRERRIMQLIRHHCGQSTYDELHRASYSLAGTQLSSTEFPARPARRIVPGTVAESAYRFACGSTASLIMPVPLARNDIQAARVAAALTAVNEDADTTAILASLDPSADREQIDHILEQAVAPANRSIARAAVLPRP